jgi:hypothetical protein
MSWFLRPTLNGSVSPRLSIYKENYPKLQQVKRR